MPISIWIADKRQKQASKSLTLVAHSTELFDIGDKATIELYGAPFGSEDDMESKTRLFICLSGTPKDLRKLSRSILDGLWKKRT